jgi:hypothetical protein
MASGTGSVIEMCSNSFLHITTYCLNHNIPFCDNANLVVAQRDVLAPGRNLNIKCDVSVKKPNIKLCSTCCRQRLC